MNVQRALRRMTDRIFTSSLTAAALAAAAALAFLVASGGQTGASGAEVRLVSAGIAAPQASKPVEATAPARAPVHVFPRHPVASVDREPVNGPSYAFVRLHSGTAVVLRSSSGEALAEVGSRSEFGGRTVLAVVRRQGDRLGVLSPQLPNGYFAWIRLDRSRMDLYWTKYALHVDLSRRTLELRYGD